MCLAASRLPRTAKRWSAGSFQALALPFIIADSPACAQGRTSMSSYASTQNGGTMSSRKFSYWSSPQMSTRSGWKASSAARALRRPTSIAARWRAAAFVPRSSPHSSRISAGQPAGSFAACGTSGSSSRFRRIDAMSSSRPLNGG